MNKINILEAHVNAIAKKIDVIFDVIQAKRDVEILLESSQYAQIFEDIKKMTPADQKHLTIVINGRPVDLNDREINVLKVLCEGGSNKCIAYELALSEKTIEKYIGKLKSKFNVPTKNNLINIANTTQLQHAFY